jgi:hypothetical protein
MAMTNAQLIQTQSPTSGQSVTVWKEPSSRPTEPSHFRKVWQSQAGPSAKAWLSWPHHEHLVLSLLAHGDAQHVVQVSALQVHPERVEVVTVDAGPDFQRDWLDCAAMQGYPLINKQEDALKLARACLEALQSIHSLGVMHGDFKSDNLCIQPLATEQKLPLRLDLKSLKLIDFAYAVYKDQPLKFVLPTDSDQLTYIPDFFRKAIRNAQATSNPSLIQSAACAQVDLYSLWFMMKHMMAADPNDQNWSTWFMWLQDCELACKRSASNSAEFDAPTRRLLIQTEKLLHQLGVPEFGWTYASTPLWSLEKSVNPTPLQYGVPTPLLTPLAQPQLGSSDPQIESEIQPSLHELNNSLVDQVPHKFFGFLNLVRHQRWSLIFVILSIVFFLIDRRFTQTGLQLTDLGFALGLMAMLFSVPMTLGCAWHVLRNSQTALKWVRPTGIILCGIAAYFLTALVPTGLPYAYAVALSVVLAFVSVAILV